MGLIDWFDNRVARGKLQLASDSASYVAAALLLSAALLMPHAAAAWEVEGVREGMSLNDSRAQLLRRYEAVDDESVVNGHQTISASRRNGAEQLKLWFCRGVVRGFAQTLSGATAEVVTFYLRKALNRRPQVEFSGSGKVSAVVFKLGDRSALLLGAEGLGTFYISHVVEPPTDDGCGKPR